MQRDYLSVADTAKLVRQALKESFPGVKFSVRSDGYSGDASIRIGWTDGPNVKQVESVAGAFEGAYFDGMIDYKGSNYHTLDGKPVSFGADFIFEERKDSDEAIARAIRTLATKYPGNFATVKDLVTPGQYRQGSLYRVPFMDGSRDGVDVYLRQILSKQSDRLAPAKSATLERIKFAGDDGYGAGTVGPDGTGRETANGYPRYERRVDAGILSGLNSGTERLS